MALRRRTIVGNIQTPSGPWVGGKVIFRLVRGSYTVESQLPVVTSTAVSDAEGDIEIDLWCDEDGILPTNYDCWLPDNAHTHRKPSFSFELQYGDGSDIDLYVLRGAGSPAETDPPLYTVIDEKIVLHAQVIASPSTLGHVKVPAENISVGGLLIFPGGGGGFEQTFSSALQWIVNHNLGRYPIPVILDNGGAICGAEIINTSLNQFIIYFASPFAGRVRCL